MNKVDKLKNVWKHLDDACGSLDNAFHELHSLQAVHEELEDTAGLIDFSMIVYLKNEIEKVIEKEEFLEETESKLL